MIESSECKYKKNTKFRDIDEIINNIQDVQQDFLVVHSKIQNPITKKNQLFSKKIPTFYFVKELVSLVLPTELDGNTVFDFTISTIQQKNIVKAIEDNYMTELEKLYLKCKHSKYLYHLNEKKVITIFRQLLKCYDYVISTQEKYSNGKKHLLYTIHKKKGESGLKKINSIIHFD